MKKEEIHVTKNYNQTEKLGKNFAKSINPGDVIFLEGELGSGKTTFSKGVAYGLGVKSRIISPTFILIRKYKTNMTNKTNSKITNLYHIDLYRLEKSEDVESLGLNELLQNKDSVVVIEWAEKLGSLLSPNWIIKFEYLNENERKIIINKYG